MNPNGRPIATPTFRGDVLKRLRWETRQSLETVGSAIGVSRQAVSLWELGQTTPTPPMVQRLAGHFGVAESDLVSR